MPLEGDLDVIVCCVVLYRLAGGGEYANSIDRAPEGREEVEGGVLSYKVPGRVYFGYYHAKYLVLFSWGTIIQCTCW